MAHSVKEGIKKPATRRQYHHSTKHICRVWLDRVEYCGVNTRLAHAACGHFVKSTSGFVECELCCYQCETKELRRIFHLKITVADESGKVCAWCAGQTASELLLMNSMNYLRLLNG